MKTVLAHIMRRKQEYRRLPLFERLRDEELPPDVRLSFMRGFAFFIMAFADLNKYVLRKVPAGDEHQERVNDHTLEDDHHWPWFLEDLEKLGWNYPSSFTETLRQLWSDDTQRSRILMYDLCALIHNANSVERLAIVEAIEETGNVLFSLTTEVAKVVERQLGKELRYMGEFHLALETGHVQQSEHRYLAAIELSESERARCIELVDRVYETFAAWTREATAQIDAAASRVVETSPA